MDYLKDMYYILENIDKLKNMDKTLDKFMEAQKILEAFSKPENSNRIPSDQIRTLVMDCIELTNVIDKFSEDAGRIYILLSLSKGEVIKEDDDREKEKGETK